MEAQQRPEDHIVDDLERVTECNQQALFQLITITRKIARHIYSKASPRTTERLFLHVTHMLVPSWNDLGCQQRYTQLL